MKNTMNPTYLRHNKKCLLCSEFIEYLFLKITALTDIINIYQMYPRNSTEKEKSKVETGGK